MVNSQLLYILLLAMVAGVILFRLYTVLGRRTGNERPPPERFERMAGATEAPQPAADAKVLADLSATRPDTSTASDPVSRGLLDIKLADRSFDTDHFIEGARKAYEMIVTAFARNDRAALKPLLSDEVYAAFDRVIAERESRKEKIEFTLVGFREVKITAATLNRNVADITVSFGAQFISVTTDSEGKVIDGDPKAVRDVTDIWSFERNVRASDPNWRLVATSGEADLQGH